MSYFINYKLPLVTIISTVYNSLGIYMSLKILYQSLVNDKSCVLF